MSTVKNIHPTNAFAEEINTLDDVTFKRYYTHNRWLSIYALDCGYQEYLDFDCGTIRLYKEHGAYHVRFFHERIEGSKATWESFEKVDEARLMFSELAYLAVNGFIACD